MLIKVLLTGKEQRTSELSTTQFLPVLVNPARAFAQVLGDLLGCQNIVYDFCVNGVRHAALFPFRVQATSSIKTVGYDI
jgi:hypothetical protein